MATYDRGSHAGQHSSRDELDGGRESERDRRWYVWVTRREFHLMREDQSAGASGWRVRRREHSVQGARGKGQEATAGGRWGEPAWSARRTAGRVGQGRDAAWAAEEA